MLGEKDIESAETRTGRGKRTGQPGLVEVTFRRVWLRLPNMPCYLHSLGISLL